MHEHDAAQQALAMMAEESTHRCSTCGQEQTAEGSVIENGTMFVDYHCGHGGHNVRRVFVANINITA